MQVKTENTHHEDILEEIIDGLRKSPKRLPTKLFYDEKGSQLFDKICELDEYYPTRTELKILDDNIEEITSYFGDDCVLVELGSGSSVKIRLLIDHLPTLAVYVPVDISSEHLVYSAECLKADHPGLRIYPLVADYTKQFVLPKISESYKTIDAFYPGSTIGNFTPDKARSFLERIANNCGKDSGLLIGVDLKKEKGILDAAYNDSKGITADFNLNILNHINELVNSDFNTNMFSHHAFFNEKRGRIEMYLISHENQVVNIDDEVITLGKDENILTEYSYKYSLRDFNKLVDGIYNIEKIWVDDNRLFSVQFLRAI
jgi:dimethylhistidine N-methyltransferase